jgi:hypothetical protein
MGAARFLLSLLMVLAVAAPGWAQRVTVTTGKGLGRGSDSTSWWIVVVALSPVLLFLGIRLAKAWSDRRARNRS